LNLQGFVYSKSNLPIISDNIIKNNGTDISAIIADLEQNTTYYVRTFLTTYEGGNYYGNQIEFKTKIGDIKIYTNPISNITEFTAKSGGYINSDGGSQISTRGVCWSESNNPTINNSKTTDGSGTGNYISNIEGLSPNKIYFVRAYATNEVGTAYGNELSFDTDLGMNIGDSYQGGLIAYVFVVGDYGYVANEEHGLIVSQKSIYSSAGNFNRYTSWGGDNVLYTKSEIGYGLENTNRMLKEGCAAACLVNDFEEGGFNDWFLPSIDELKKVAELYLAINKRYDFADNEYWSSTQYIYDKRVALTMELPGGGFQSGDYKYRSHFVLATRYF